EAIVVVDDEEFVHLARSMAGDCARDERRAFLLPVSVVRPFEPRRHLGEGLDDRFAVRGSILGAGRAQDDRAVGEGGGHDRGWYPRVPRRGASLEQPLSALPRG